MNNKSWLLTFSVVVAALTISCGGVSTSDCSFSQQDGEYSITCRDGTTASWHGSSPGPGGFATLFSASDEVSADCPTGGRRFDIGLDNGDGGGIAGNGILEPGEIDSTAHVCRGAAGQNGSTGSGGGEGAPAGVGPTGSTGASGTAGVGTGGVGPTGAVGATGSVGASGATGAAGTTGSSGGQGGVDPWAFELPSAIPRGNLPTTDGVINAIARIGNILYIGGDFTEVSPPTTGGAALSPSPTNGQPIRLAPRFGGSFSSVTAAVADGLGGYFVGGSFTSVGDTEQAYLAHILSDGSVDQAFTPRPNGSITALALAGPLSAGVKLYVSGEFFVIGGQPRPHFAELDATTGYATDLDIRMNGRANAMVLSGSTLYMGGTFSQITQTSTIYNRNRAAALDITTRSITTWDPNATPSSVISIAVGDSFVYLGGSFTSVGGQARNNIAAVSKSGTGAVDATWNPNATGLVNALAFRGTTVFAGGYFTHIGGQDRTRLAALSSSGSGNATTWNPSIPSDYVSALAVSTDGTTLYVGGFFQSIAGANRNNLAAFDSISTTPTLTAWDPNADQSISALVTSNLTGSAAGEVVYAAGVFTTVGRRTRNRIAAIEAASGAIMDWNPGADLQVTSLAADGAMLYVGGNFTTFAAATHNHLAAVNTSTGEVLGSSWGADSQINAMAVGENTLYVGGTFFNVGGGAHSGLAALDKTTGQAKSWDANATSGAVNALALDGEKLYVGGSFLRIGGQDRNRLASVSTLTGAATNWNPNASDVVHALALGTDALYAGGAFTTIGGQDHKRLAGFDRSTGAVTSWNPNLDNTVYSIAVGGRAIFAGGDFTQVGTSTRNSLAAFDPVLHTLFSWNPSVGQVSPSVRALASVGSELYVGGTFTKIGSLSRMYLASFRP